MTFVMSWINATMTPTNTSSINDDSRLLPPEHVYLLLLVIPLGITGNALSAAVMLRRRFRSLSSSVYLLALAVVDTLCLLLDLKVQDWLQHLGVPPARSYPASCLLYWWLTQSVPFMSSWLVAAVTVERVVIVCRPLQAKALCTRSKACGVVAAIVILMLVCNAYVFHLVDPNPCAPDSSLKLLLGVLAVSTYSLLPFAVIFVCNLTIAVNLIRQRRYVVRHMGTGSVSAQAQTDTHRLTGMLVANSCVFIILTLPYNVIVSYSIATGEGYRLMTGFRVANFMVTLNHSINFLLYVICGSLYRQELSAMFCGRCQRRDGYGRGQTIELDDHTIHTSM